MSQAGSSLSGEVLTPALPRLAGYWWGGGRVGAGMCPFALWLSVSSMGIAGVVMVVFLLGPFSVLGEQFQEGETIPKDPQSHAQGSLSVGKML